MASNGRIVGIEDRTSFDRRVAHANSRLFGSHDWAPAGNVAGAGSESIPVLIELTESGFPTSEQYNDDYMIGLRRQAKPWKVVSRYTEAEYEILLVLRASDRMFYGTVISVQGGSLPEEQIKRVMLVPGPADELHVAPGWLL